MNNPLVTPPLEHAPYPAPRTADGVSAVHGALLVVAPVLAIFAIVVPLPVVPQLVAAFPGQGTGVAIALAAPNLTIALAGLILGLFGARWPRRPLFLAAFGVVALTAPLPALVDSLDVIIAARMATGLSLGVMITAGMALTGDYFRGARRAFWLSAMTGIPSLLAIACAVLCGYLGRYGWQAPFWVLGFAAPLFLIALCIPAPRIGQVAESGAEVPDQSSKSPMASALPIYTVLLLAALVVFTPGYEMGFVLYQRAPPTAVFMGAMASMICLGAALGAASLKLLDPISPSVKLAAGFLCSALGQALIAGSDGRIPLLLGAIAVGSAQGLIVPTLSLRLLAKFGGAQRGRAVGLFQTLLYVGLFLGPLIARKASEFVQSAASTMFHYAGTSLLVCFGLIVISALGKRFSA